MPGPRMQNGICDTLEFQAIRDTVVSYCSSPLGRAIAGNLQPSRKYGLVATMIRQVTEMCRFLENGGQFPSRGARDAVSLLESAVEMNHAMDPEGLRVVCDLIACSRRIKKNLVELEEELPELIKVLKGVEDLTGLESELNRTVDGAGKVLDSASPRLARIRLQMESLAAEIRRKAEACLGDRIVASCLQEAKLRIRDDRFVVAVRYEARRRVKGIIHGYSSSGSTVFIEPEVLLEPQNRLEEARVREAREISRILWETTRLLMEKLKPLRTLQRAVAWLDFTYGRARYTIEYGLAAPELDRDGKLDLREARHPVLLKMAFDRIEGSPEERIAHAHREVVPLDIHLGQRFHILVITGPNTGGKTVALKAAGLCTLMALAGLHVPVAPGSVVPFASAVLADIGDEQDIFQNLSTFSSHMKRIREIVETADSRSLVLLDELGSGTDPQEGEALGRAILTFLLARQAKVLVSTHLSRLKEFAFSNDGVENGCMEFDPDSLKPTFNLRIGMPGESNAIRIARRLGIPGAILDEAEESLSSSRGKEHLLMDGIARARIQVESELTEAQNKTREMERLKEEAATDKEQISRKKAILEEEAEREIDTCLRRSQEEIRSILTRLQFVPEQHKEAVRELEEVVDGIAERTALAAKRREFIKTLRKGDLVYIPRYREKCRVVRLKKKDKKLEVQYRNLLVDIAFSDVMWPHWF